MNKARIKHMPLCRCKAIYSFIAAAVLYIVLACYYLHPVKSPGGPQTIIAATWVAGATGCFVLSRRWIAAFAASLLAGAIYGFGPFALGFAAYHPLAGVPLAFVPWLFCPAAFWRKWRPSVSRRLAKTGALAGSSVTAVLCLLPFCGIVGFFWLCGRPEIGPVFPMPVSLRLEPDKLAGLAAPLTMRPHDFILSFYHVPLAALAMGLCIFFESRRHAVLVPVGAAAVLSFAGPLAQVSPIVWALIPVLFGSIVIGLGAEGLAWAGPSDGKWLLFCAAAVAIVAGACLYLSFTDGMIYRRTAILHAGGLLSVGVIFALTRAELRLHLLRWLLLGATLGADMLGSGKYLADKVL